MEYFKLIFRLTFEYIMVEPLRVSLAFPFTRNTQP